jgi:type IV pilus assembly protein PilM
MKLTFGDLLKPVVTGLPKLLPRMGHRFSIGLDLGPGALNLVQMESSSGKTCIQAVASLPCTSPIGDLYENPRELKALLQQAFAMQAFKGTHVVSCLPAKDIRITTIAYRPTKGQSNSEAILAELRERLGDELNDLVLDFMTVRHEGTEVSDGEALVALAPRKMVLTYLELLTEAGLEVSALDFGPAALARLVRHAGALGWPDFPSLPNALLVNFSADASFVTVLSGRRLMLDRAVATEGKIGEAPRPEISQLLQEIRRTLEYMALKTPGNSIDIIYLAGSAAGDPAVLTAIREQFQIRVEVLNPIALFESSSCELRHDHGIGMMPGVALAAGLALREVPEHG